MGKFHTRHGSDISSGRNGKAGGCGYTLSVESVGETLTTSTRRLWLVAVAVLAIGVFSEPASAQQTPVTGRWAIQGGPYVGASIYREVLPELGLRFGAKRGPRAFDLSVSAYQGQYYVRPMRRWFFNVLAGLAWQPNYLSIGARSGFVVGKSVLGERGWAMELGPHTALSVPLGSLFQLRSEAGAHLFISPTAGLGGPRGYLRIGIEAGRR